jgi:RimJ/RimL family protein N-acetyltransferase
VSDSRPITLELPDELVGPRVVIRCFRDDDSPALWEAIDESRDSVGRWLPWVNAYQSVDDLLPFIRETQAKWILRENFGLGIFDRGTGRLFGGCGLRPGDWQIRSFEIGYWIRLSAAGNGYVTEAVRVLTTFAFDCLEANRVQIRMDVRNARSRAIPERLGFVYEGCQRRSLPDVNGQPRDVAVFALIPDDYRGLQSSPNWA